MSQASLRPKFTWWPYRALALLVPLLSAVASYLAFEQSNEPDRNNRELSAFVVFFAILGAGNAYLFAIAIGDFGKSVLSVPFGALAGFVAVHVLGYSTVSAVYGAFLVLIATYGMITGALSSVTGIAAAGLLSLAVVGMISERGTFNAELAQFFGYPFICGMVAASMPYERNTEGRISAWATGSLSAIYGMVISFGITVVLALLIETLVNPAGGVRREDQWLAGSIVRWVVFSQANYFCAKHLFYSVYRVSDKAPISETPENETPATANPTSPESPETKKPHPPTKKK